jgi:multiple sugar transport system substrate-binding protein
MGEQPRSVAVSAAVTRRQFLQGSAGLGGLLATGGLAAVLAACGRAAQETPAGEPGEEFTGSLALLLGSHMGPVQELADQYEEQHGVSPQVQEITTPDLRSVVTSAFLAQNSPWDAIFTTAVLAQELGDRTWVQTVDAFLDESVRPAGELMDRGLGAVSAPEGYLAVPWTMGAPLMHWNRQLLESVDLDPDAPAGWHAEPNSWDTFVEYAQALTFERNGTQYYGFTDAWADDHILYTWGSLLQMHGGRFLDDEREPVFNDEAGVEATMKMYDLLNTHRVVDPAVNTYTWVFDASPGFLNGTRAFFFTWPFIAGVANDPEGSEIVGENAFAPQPAVETSASVDGSEFLAVPVFADNEDEAWRFLELVTSPEGQRTIALGGWASIYRDVNLDPEVLEAFPVNEAVVQSYEYPVDGGYSADREIWGPILGNQIQEVLADNKSAEEALDDAVRLIRDEREG